MKFKIGDRVRHSGYGLKGLRDYWLGYTPMSRSAWRNSIARIPVAKGCAPKE